MLILLFSLYVIVHCVLAYGMIAGHFLKNYNSLNREDAGNIVIFTFITGILPGFGLFLIFCMTGFAEGGLKYVNPFKQE